ncbi:MAG: hypothetical protein ACU84H_08790 [Gammaproteobacteria bacterium]
MRTTNNFIKKVIQAAAALTAALTLSVSAGPPEHVLSLDNPGVERIIAVQEEVTDELMATDGIIGTAVGLDHQGGLVLQVFVNSEHPDMADIIANIPKGMGGVPLNVKVTEPFRPMPAIRPVPGKKPGGGGGGGGVSHTAKQTAPIQLGTSGGWRYNLSNGYCCGGTLGSLVANGGKQYILSNYHVLEADIVNGGNGRIAQTGDPVIQPGLIDMSCNANNAQNVATLSGIKSLPNFNVDAAIAEVGPGMVDTSGSILEIGKISSSTVGASLNQAVKKSGRTTGLTRSSVSGLNATVSVAYDNECAGGAAFTKTYTGQILVNNRIGKGKSFLAGGDSGSLMVEDAATNPKAVGLLFAGSSSIAVANPIGQVLSFFGATMVGN